MCLKKHSMYRTLPCLDAHETIEVSIDVAKRRWCTEIVAREKLFLELLGVTKAPAQPVLISRNLESMEAPPAGGASSCTSSHVVGDIPHGSLSWCVRKPRQRR